jgi:hypothetical protein
MEKHKIDSLFDEQVEQIIIHYIDDDNMWKIDYVDNFIRKNFHVEEIDNSFIEIEKIHSKSLLWLLLSLIIDYEAMKEITNRQILKQNGLFDPPSQKMKLHEEKRRQEKYNSLEVEDIFSVKELTPEDVLFIEHILSKTNVDLDKVKNFVISTNQVIYLLRKIMQEYKTFLGNGEKFEDL